MANFSEEGDFENVFYSYLNTPRVTRFVVCWYLIVIAQTNMTGDKTYFIWIDKGIKANITLLDGRTQEVPSKGTIALKAENGLTKYIQDVLCVPGLAQIFQV